MVEIIIAMKRLLDRQEHHQFDIPWYNEILFAALFFLFGLFF